MSERAMAAFWTRLCEVVTDDELRDALVEWVSGQVDRDPVDIPISDVRLLVAYVTATETEPINLTD